jgi:hypothetical protein
MRIFVSNGHTDFEGVVDAAADLDGRFILTTDEGERFAINGWQVTDLEVLEA